MHLDKDYYVYWHCRITPTALHESELYFKRLTMHRVSFISEKTHFFLLMYAFFKNYIYIILTRKHRSVNFSLTLKLYCAFYDETAVRPEYRLPRLPQVSEKLPNVPGGIGRSLNFVWDRRAILASWHVYHFPLEPSGSHSFLLTKSWNLLCKVETAHCIEAKR